jgi:1,4-dihydroxy-2-naphthoate octaprenyltransferase
MQEVSMAADVITRNKSYIIGTRLPFSSASVLPAILGGALGWVYHPAEFNLLHAVTAVLGVLFLHLGANTINDYFDWDLSDKVNRFPTPFSGGSRCRLEHVLTRESFLFMALVFFALAAAVAAFLVLLGKPLVSLIGTAGAFCGLLYSVRPFSLQSRGLGEPTIFLAFGPLITLGMGYAACGTFSLDFFLAGVPNGLLVANILWINEFPDVEADSSSGKRNLVVRLGTARARYGYIAIVALFYVSIVLLASFGVLPLWSLLVLLSLPLAVKTCLFVWRNHRNPLVIVPAQARTIQLQIITAVLLILAVVLDKFV